MGVRIPTDFCLMSWHTLTDGDNEEMVWTLGGNVVSANDVTSIPDLMFTVWDDHLKSLTSSAVTLVRTVAKLGPNATGPTYEAAQNTDGTNGGSLPPPNCAVLVKKLTSLGGRHGRGRAYLPGISSISGSLNSAGVFSVANATTVAAAMSGLGNDLSVDATIGPVLPVVLHDDSTTPTLITGYSCPNKLATQRRRLRP